MVKVKGGICFSSAAGAFDPANFPNHLDTDMPSLGEIVACECEKEVKYEFSIQDFSVCE